LISGAYRRPHLSTPVLRSQVLPLVAPAVGVAALSEFGRHLPVLTAAFVSAGICAVSRPVVGVAVVLVAATDPSLFRSPAIGPLTAVDLLIATVVARSILSAELRRPTWREWCAFTFLGAGAVATAAAGAGSAGTAFVRVASYMILGLAVGRTLRMGERLLLTRVFVGAQVGQALIAILSITASAPTAFPFGRYLGTLGDPAQFGIPIAFAAVLVAVSPYIIRDTRVRIAVLVLLVVAVAGSVTRSAWAVAGVGGLLALLERIGRDRSLRMRAALSLGALSIAVAGTVIAVAGAGAIGLNPESAEIRHRSIETGWSYLTDHPLRPRGLGNHPVRIIPSEAALVVGSPKARNRCSNNRVGEATIVQIAMSRRGTYCPDLIDSTSETAVRRRGNLVPDSSFENDTLAWTAFRSAQIQRHLGEAVFGSSSLTVRTRGAAVGEGVASASHIPDIDGGSFYTLSIYAKIPPRVRIRLYRDEFDEAGRWLAYGYATMTGTGAWTRFSDTWRTAREAAEIRVFVITGRKTETVFVVDAVQLERGRMQQAYVDGIGAPLVERFAIYNTWLAVAIALGIIASASLFVLAAGDAYHAYRLGDTPLSFALTAILIPSLTENFVYAVSLVTLIWLAALGLVATAGKAYSEPVQN
jgi:Carbohydrate binding domain